MNAKLKLRGRIKGYLMVPVILIFAVALAAGFFLWYDRDVGIVLACFAGVYAAVVLIVYGVIHKSLAQEIVDFATQYGSVQKKLLDQFVIPYALLDGAARLLWVNEQFTALTSKEKTYHKSITTLIPTLTRELLNKPEVPDQIVEIDQRTYRVAVSKISFGDFVGDTKILAMNEEETFLTALYFFDETDFRQVLRENEENRLVSGLIYIDNYEETLESVEDVRQSMLLALVDRRVTKYFSKADGLVRKIEKDKYFVVFRYKYLVKMKEEKFKLLDDVKGIKLGINS